MTTLSAGRVGDLRKMFGTDVKTTVTPPRRWPATRKTARNAEKILEQQEDDLGTPQGVPKKC